MAIIDKPVIDKTPQMLPKASPSSGRLPFGNAFAQAVTPALPLAAPADTAKVSPVDALSLNTTGPEGLTGAERALQQLVGAYGRMLTAINLKLFNPDRIEEYIRRAEKRAGVDMTDVEKDRIRRLAKSTDKRVLRLLCLELRVGIPKKEEADAERAFGQLLLARHDKPALQRFLDDSNADENLKAHVRAVLMLGHVETWMNRYEQFKEQLNPLKKIPFIFSNN